MLLLRSSVLHHKFNEHDRSSRRHTASMTLVQIASHLLSSCFPDSTTELQLDGLDNVVTLHMEKRHQVVIPVSC